MPSKTGLTSVVIVGYGNVGRGVHRAIEKNPDIDLLGIVSRDVERTKRELRSASKEGMLLVCSPNSDAAINSIGADVAILCGGSKKDLPEQGPHYASHFNTVDSFDTHAHIAPYVDEETGEPREGYFGEMHNAGYRTGHTSIVSAGWDPGTFSIERVLADAFIPGCIPKGFYGLTESGGLSMGHSDAIRTIKGVKDARQYTHAMPEAIERIRREGNPQLTQRDMHWRECFVVLENDTLEERARIDREIKRMRNYFEPYRTTVEFISQKELNAKCGSRMPHDGLVIASGETGKANLATIEYRNTWDSNPEATGSILVACARACQRMHEDGKNGAFTMLDIPPAYYSPRTAEELRKNFM